MRRKSATKSSKNTRKGKKGKSSGGRGPSQARMPAGFPTGMGGFGSGGPAGFGQLPPQLPPGMELPDLSKLNLPKK